MSMKFLASITIVICIGVAAYFLYQSYNSGEAGKNIETMPKSNDFSQDAKSVNQDQLKAISIAEEKIMEKYPDMQEHGRSIQLIRAVPVEGKPGKWFLRYDIPEMEDAAIEMIVDINTGEITEYKDDWA